MAKYNYQKIGLIAQQILVKKCNVNFPIDILNVIKQFPNVEIMTYLEFDSEESNPGFKARSISSDAFTINVGDDKYIIVYNDDTSENLVQRIRFSLAHEIGHINLHHFEYGETILARGRFGISDKQYNFFEKEADIFANQLLAPPYLILDKWETEDVVEFFDISSSSAQITYSIKKQYPWLSPYDIFKNAFSRSTYIPRKSYIDALARNNDDFEGFQKYFLQKNFHFCKNCRSLEINFKNKLKFCSICGSNNLKIVSSSRYFQFHELEEQLVEFFAKDTEKEMKYNILKVDEEGRLNEPCPRCGNENPTNNYCSVCGVDIINKCSSDGDFNICESGPLKGHERYCPLCGCSSTFLNNGLLKSWDSNIKTTSSQYHF